MRPISQSTNSLSISKEGGTYSYIGIMKQIHIQTISGRDINTQTTKGGRNGTDRACIHKNPKLSQAFWEFIIMTTEAPQKTYSV